MAFSGPVPPGSPSAATDIIEDLIVDGSVASV
jgi:hypothetical protein